MKTREEKMGVGKTLIDRLNTLVLTFLLDVEKRVQAGERLTDADLERLQEALEVAQSNQGVVDELVKEFPDLQSLRSRVVDLYQTITSKALENEEKSGDD